MTEIPFDSKPTTVGHVHDNLAVELHRDHGAHDSYGPQWVQLRLNQDSDPWRLAPDAQPPYGLFDLSDEHARRLDDLVREARGKAREGAGLI